MYSIYFDYETPAMRKNHSGVSDYCIEFNTVNKARKYFKRLINRARETNTVIDIVVYCNDVVIYDAFYYSDGRVHVRNQRNKRGA